MITIIISLLVYLVFKQSAQSFAKEAGEYNFETGIIFFACIMSGIVFAFAMGDIAQKEMTITEISNLNSLEKNNSIYFKIESSAVTKFIVFKKENSTKTEEMELGNKNVIIIKDAEAVPFIVIYDLTFKNPLATLFCLGNFKQHRIYEFHVPK
ncbi:MAG: hypothetical protein UT05_C0009G0023 [Parcubacteria group bacterium GW2011_GWF2_38_76]|nr:MAG: hypothetical protein UT05_C0009G0023 [Parcubacteria group bacterium GW2011_GWF2_38_76]HBM45466.1 hypothetical protein [Patescibacteria group bacterium]